MQSHYSTKNTEWKTKHQNTLNKLPAKARDMLWVVGKEWHCFITSIPLFPAPSCWKMWRPLRLGSQELSFVVWWSLSPMRQKHPQFLESLNFSSAQKEFSLNIADIESRLQESVPGILISCLKEERWYSKCIWHTGVNRVFKIKIRPFILRGASDLSNHAEGSGILPNITLTLFQFILGMLTVRSHISATGNSCPKIMLHLFCVDF